MELILTPPVPSAVIQATGNINSFLSVELAEAKSFELRDYQKDCIAQILDMWRIGRRAPLLYAPTGSGKTALAAHLINSENQAGRRVLFLVHRQELVEQNSPLLFKFTELIVATLRRTMNRQTVSHSVIIAGMQTIARRQDKFPQNIALVIVGRVPYHGLVQDLSTT